jgi:hypothetical protein
MCRHGRAAVIFTEWHPRTLLLRVATHTTAGWRVATLDSRGLPIWSQRVSISANGTVVAAWIDEVGAHRSLHAAELAPGGNWQTTVLDEGDGLGSISLGSGTGDLVTAAWSDRLAGETRVRAAIYAGGTWHPVATLARSLALLDSVRLVRPGARSLSWRLWDAGHASFFRARRHGLVWGKGVPAPRTTRRYSVRAS